MVSKDDPLIESMGLLKVGTKGMKLPEAWGFLGEDKDSLSRSGTSNLRPDES